MEVLFRLKLLNALVTLTLTDVFPLGHLQAKVFVSMSPFRV